MTIIRTWPRFSPEHDRNPLPFRVPLVFSMFFLISQPRVSGPKTEHERFFRSLIPCMRLANLRATKKSLPLVTQTYSHDPAHCIGQKARGCIFMERFGLQRLLQWRNDLLNTLCRVRARSKCERSTASRCGNKS